MSLIDDLNSAVTRLETAADKLVSALTADQPNLQPAIDSLNAAAQKAEDALNPPTSKSSDWTTSIDPSTGGEIWTNKLTGEVVTADPNPAAPAGSTWVAGFDQGGNQTWTNSADGEVVLVDPNPAAA